MNTEMLVSSPIGKMFGKVLARGMESRFRYRFFGPAKILEGVDGLQGQTVLEIGCGTGFFTIPAARLIGDQGSLVAMDIIPESVEMVSKKVQTAQLHNVRVVKGDALRTNLDSASFQTVILFGVIPAPMVPLNQLLIELHRVLRPEGSLAVWPPVPGWLPQSVLKAGLFTLSSKRNNVYNFKRP
jgi:demethylmenaquinone methyltransferase/2-methoxy-6-polyprenyl-1,4-benzoquinol methylase